MKRILVFASHLFILSLILWQVVPKPAHAYLDPGMGSSIVQIVIAALATVSYLVKVFWKQISAFFGGIFHKKAKAGPESPTKETKQSVQKSS